MGVQNFRKIVEPFGGVDLTKAPPSVRFVSDEPEGEQSELGQMLADMAITTVPENFYLGGGVTVSEESVTGRALVIDMSGAVHQAWRGGTHHRKGSTVHPSQAIPTKEQIMGCVKGVSQFIETLKHHVTQCGEVHLVFDGPPRPNKKRKRSVCVSGDVAGSSSSSSLKGRAMLGRPTSRLIEAYIGELTAKPWAEAKRDAVSFAKEKASVVQAEAWCRALVDCGWDEAEIRTALGAALMSGMPPPGEIYKLLRLLYKEKEGFIIENAKHEADRRIEELVHYYQRDVVVGTWDTDLSLTTISVQIWVQSGVFHVTDSRKIWLMLAMTAQKYLLSAREMQDVDDRRKRQKEINERVAQAMAHFFGYVREFELELDTTEKPTKYHIYTVVHIFSCFAYNKTDYHEGVFRYGPKKTQKDLVTGRLDLEKLDEALPRDVMEEWLPAMWNAAVYLKKRLRVVSE